MATTKTRTVRYVGASKRGREIDGVGRVFPPGVQIPAAEQPEDAKKPVMVAAPNTADVDEQTALGLIRSADWEPVGWTPDAPATEEEGGDEGSDEGSEGVPFPRHKGGGNYELSDGSTVRGKDEAIAAQTALDQAGADGAGDDDDQDGGDA